MPHVQTRLGGLFVESIGQGPAITMWHCLLGDSRIWQPQLEALSKQARVVLVDGPSHGRSDPFFRRFSMMECALAWLEVLDSLEIDRAAFCGLSWGAMAALRVALHAPARVRALALFGATSVAHHPRDVPRFFALVGAVRLVGMHPLLHPFVARTMVAPSSDPRHARELLQRARLLDRRALSKAIRSVLLDADDVTHELWRLKMPALVAVGSRDPMTPRRLSRTIAKSMTTARLEIVAGMGHLLPLEAPEATTGLLAELVRRTA
ncbi:MAG: alpha/beta fold hydrolase [Deltaproteobacteria bacterium]|nr:alpha/beta fold hydrolase [Deltaproteobacteria bacterium]